MLHVPVVQYCGTGAAVLGRSAATECDPELETGFADELPPRGPPFGVDFARDDIRQNVLIPPNTLMELRRTACPCAEKARTVQAGLNTKLRTDGRGPFFGDWASSTSRCVLALPQLDVFFDFIAAAASTPARR